MGFLDSFIKDIANGDLDKKLEKLADNVEKFSDKIESKAKTAVEKSEQLSQKVDQVGTSTVKIIDVHAE